MRKSTWLGTAAAVLMIALAGPAISGATFDGVRNRGQMACGVNVGIAGFSAPDSQGIWRGFDADICRAVAAAVLGDANKVRFVPLTGPQRFVATSSGEVDVLIRQTTFTLTRDAGLGLRMTAPYLYDGHAFMVRRDARVNEPKQMDGMTICMPPGTTNELITSDLFRSLGVKFTPLLIERSPDSGTALEAGRCDAIGNDATALAALRSQFKNPQDYVILDGRYSKEPYGPVVRRDDQEWFDVVRWTVMALIQAEELGVTSANAEELRRTSTNPEIRRLLGADPLLGEALKIDKSWAYNAIRAVGNYGEIFACNLGPDSALALARGANDLWTRGGLLYAWPLR
jgi:general L-amino acid transport system substrate-binding protein